MKFRLSAFLFVALLAAPLFAEDSSPKTPPKVLIIGDSISIAYTPYVKELLQGKAEVTHHKGNAGPTIRAVANIEDWLGDAKWDVIHFNVGLWDMYGWEYAKEDRSPAMYQKRLRQLATRLKKTGAVVIWGTTTPACPDPEVTMRKRFKTDVTISASKEQAYLIAAAKVMRENEIEINDLHALMLPELKKFALAPDNVHFTAQGNKKLAAKVALAIEAHLPKNSD